MFNSAPKQNYENSREISANESLELALTIVEAAADRKGDNILLLKVSDVTYLADYFVIITGYSNVQIRAIYQAIAEKAELDCQRYASRVEGQSEASWILMDYGDAIVHILKPKERDFYNLEAFWGHGEQIDISELTGEINN
ncbi:MAG: ribosome silencing factor [Cyanobacteriota bacterium]|nr:ribosome silencing factor [Cyanobacteriota bacterium]